MLLLEIQQRLRDAIKTSGIPQKIIAERIGVNPSTVSKYIRLDKFPSIETFAKLCIVLEVSADYILGIQ